MCMVLTFYLLSLLDKKSGERKSECDSYRQEGLQQGVTVEALLSPDGVSLSDLDRAGLIHISQDMEDALKYYAQSRNSGYNSLWQEEEDAKKAGIELYKNLLQIKIKLPAPDTMTVVVQPVTPPPATQ